MSTAIKLGSNKKLGVCGKKIKYYITKNCRKGQYN